MPIKTDGREYKPIWAKGLTCNFPQVQIDRAFDLIDKGVFPNFSSIIQMGVRDYLEINYYIPLIDRKVQLDDFDRKLKIKKIKKIQLKSGEIIEIST